MPEPRLASQPENLFIDKRSNQGKEFFRQNIASDLEKFAKEHKIKSLRDRLRIGLNEVGILAYEKTREKIMELCIKMTQNSEEAKMVYENLVDMTVDIQEHGPWDYAVDISKSESPEIKAWYILTAAESMGYEREMDLTDQEFREDVERIKDHLDKAVEDPEKFYLEAKQHVTKKAEALIRFNENDKEKNIPLGEGLVTFLPMAIKGYEVGIAQDAEGWVYVGARGRISDNLIESCGLQKKVTSDPRDSSRQVIMFTNDKGQEIAKKLYRGFLVILSRNLNLAEQIARAIRNEQEVVKIATEAVTHTRVIQTSEKKRLDDKEADLWHWKNKKFLRTSNDGLVIDGSIQEKRLSRPREEFYDRMLYIRGMYVFLDALRNLRDKAKEDGREVKRSDVEVLSQKTWEKMKQKVEELRYINGLLAQDSGFMSERVKSVVDMAGGAGDLGLAVGSDLMAQGKEIEDIEIVDPQEGTDDFMENIIDHLPFREKLKKVAHHNTGFLQDAHIRPDAMVVAKHACGTLTDNIIKMWIESKSPVLVAMTCCQDKASNEPALYGMGQKEWHDACTVSALTNTEVPEEPGIARDIALKKQRLGQEAMYKLDLARVEYLRRHGFKAELRTTDKFPKGDVIIARRLPDNFLQKVNDLKELEKNSPVKFDAMILRLEKMVMGKMRRRDDLLVLGENWILDDVRELLARLSPVEIARQQIAKIERRQRATKEYIEKVATEEKRRTEKDAADRKKVAKQRMDSVLKEVFAEEKGKLNIYLSSRSARTGRLIPKSEYGVLTSMINDIILENFDKKPLFIREKIESLLDLKGY